MKFKVKALSYLFGTLVPAGEIYDYPDDKLPRNEDGSIRFEKLSQLEPVKAVKAPAPNAKDAQAIKDAVEALDKGVDAHWTKGGLPSVETIKEFVGFDVTRKDIDAVAAGYTRPAE